MTMCYEFMVYSKENLRNISYVRKFSYVYNIIMCRIISLHSLTPWLNILLKEDTCQAIAIGRKKSLPIRE